MRRIWYHGTLFVSTSATCLNDCGILPLKRLLIICRHLYDNNLTGSLPPELGWLSQLEELRVEINRLNGTVPASFGALQNLVLL